jgi:hypothetical protein
MSRPPLALQMAAILALAAVDLPEETDRPRSRPNRDEPEPRRVLPEDPEVAQVVRDLKERRRQNFLKQRKS